MLWDIRLQANHFSIQRSVIQDVWLVWRPLLGWILSSICVECDSSPNPSPNERGVQSCSNMWFALPYSSCSWIFILLFNYLLAICCCLLTSSPINLLDHWGLVLPVVKCGQLALVNNVLEGYRLLSLTSRAGFERHGLLICSAMVLNCNLLFSSIWILLRINGSKLDLTWLVYNQLIKNVY